MEHKIGYERLIAILNSTAAFLMLQKTRANSEWVAVTTRGEYGDEPEARIERILELQVIKESFAARLHLLSAIRIKLQETTPLLDREYTPKEAIQALGLDNRNSLATNPFGEEALGYLAGRLEETTFALMRDIEAMADEYQQFFRESSECIDLIRSHTALDWDAIPDWRKQG